jgi:succinate dehydrogenase / fumarate reductase cytochrome b subunit
MTDMNRPLSPHLGIYRWQWSNTLSILHRATGVMLALGAVVFTAWLVAIASGPDAYLGVVAWLGSPVGLLLLFGWSFCFFYHLCNGVRHLCWDAGYGFGLARARATGLAAAAIAVLLTVAFWLVALTGGGA